MLKKKEINGIKWIDWVNIPEKEIVKNLAKYNIHELDLKACLEWNQRARVDKHDDYTFIVCHFPKFNRLTKIYELNEFNIFLSKEFLLTFREFHFAKINKIYESMWKRKLSQDSQTLKVTTSYILYEVIQAMLEKMFNMIKNIKLDIRSLEKEVFEEWKPSLVKDIMIKKRNIVVLKHIFKPQVNILKQLESVVNKFYAEEMEVYFEDLEDKLSQIISEVDILSEYIDSVEDAFKSMIDIKTNFTMKILTIFSAFLLPLTLITSFYGMNITLPYAENSFFIFNLLWMSIILMLIIYLLLKRNWKF
jgi:magnesium transporter